MKKYRQLLVIIIFSTGICTFAQQIDFKSDLILIKDKLVQKEVDPYRRPYIYKDDTSLIKKINPVNILFGTSLYVYQNLISRQLSAKCLYYPSCSEFAGEALREFGLLKGTFLSLDRVNRCGRIQSRNLKNLKIDAATGRYSDPVSRYKREK